jgi:hypothetical protein
VDPARPSPQSGQPDPLDLTFMVNSTHFWFDHEIDQNFVELTIVGLSPGCTTAGTPPVSTPTAGWCSESGHRDHRRQRAQDALDTIDWLPS